MQDLVAQIMIDHAAFYGLDPLLHNKEVLRSTVGDVLKKVPGTVGELREIILSQYDPSEDTKESRKELISFLLAYLIAIEVVELV